MATSDHGMLAILLVVGFMVLIAIADLVRNGQDVAAVLLGAAFAALVLIIGGNP